MFCSGDPIDFMSWILNALHIALDGSKKLGSSVINRTFRGNLYILLQCMALLGAFSFLTYKLTASTIPSKPFVSLAQ